jgi:hypothetical protein
MPDSSAFGGRNAQRGGQWQLIPRGSSRSPLHAGDAEPQSAEVLYSSSNPLPVLHGPDIRDVLKRLSPGFVKARVVRNMVGVVKCPSRLQTRAVNPVP